MVLRSRTSINTGDTAALDDDEQPPVCEEGDNFSDNEQQQRRLYTLPSRQYNQRRSLILAALPSRRNHHENTTNHAEADDDIIDIPNDSFSMLYVAETLYEHVFPLAIFAIQMVILVLISINLLEINEREISAKLNIPADVPLTVKISQFVACVVSVFTAGDFVSGIVFQCSRVSRDNTSYYGVAHQLEGIDNEEEEAPPPKISKKFELTNILRLTAGALVILVSFIFIVQSRVVIELWLNFAGVAFVGTLGDVAFHLATYNFFGITAERVAFRVSTVKIHTKKTSKKASGRVNSRRTKRILLFSGLTAALWAMLSIAMKRQADQMYSCRVVSLEVKDADHLAPWARFYSGEYKRDEGRKYGDRAVYRQVDGRGYTIAYCPDELRWTVSWAADWCNTFALMSERTRSFDIMDVNTINFWTRENIDATLKCVDCNPERGERDCGWRGMCNKETKSCDCYENYFGNSCQFRGPCTELAMDDEFYGWEHGWEKNFHLLYHKGDPVFFLERPVYYQRLPATSDQFGIMLYDGGRWEVIRSGFIENMSVDTVESLAEYMYHNFTNEQLENTDVLFVSDSTTTGSPSNVPFFGWLSFAATHIGKLHEEEFILRCADCAASCKDDWDLEWCERTMKKEARGTFCNDDICVEVEGLNGPVNRCACDPGFMGPLCNVPPVEGSVSLHLQHSGTGSVCSVCEGGDFWYAYKLDGLNNTCITFPKKQPLVFQSDDGDTIFRQVALTLNLTHYSVLIGIDGRDDLCENQEGQYVIDSFLRNVSDERVNLDYAVYLNKTKGFLGELVKPSADVAECMKETDIDQSVCDSTDLSEVYSTGEVSSLDKAWVHFQLKVTPFSSSAQLP